MAARQQLLKVLQGNHRKPIILNPSWFEVHIPTSPWGWRGRRSWTDCGGHCHGLRRVRLNDESAELAINFFWRWNEWSLDAFSYIFMETVLVKDQGGLVHHLCHLANVPTARHLSAKLFKWCAGDAVQTSVIGFKTGFYRRYIFTYSVTFWKCGLYVLMLFLKRIGTVSQVKSVKLQNDGLSFAMLARWLNMKKRTALCVGAARAANAVSERGAWMEARRSKVETWKSYGSARMMSPPWSHSLES